MYNIQKFIYEEEETLEFKAGEDLNVKDGINI